MKQQTNQSNQTQPTENQQPIWVTAKTTKGTKIKLPADTPKEAEAYIKLFRSLGFHRIGVCEPANKQGYPQIWTVTEVNP